MGSPRPGMAPGSTADELGHVDLAALEHGLGLRDRLIPDVDVGLDLLQLLEGAVDLGVIEGVDLIRGYPVCEERKLGVSCHQRTEQGPPSLEVGGIPEVRPSAGSTACEGVRIVGDTPCDRPPAVAPFVHRGREMLAGITDDAEVDRVRQPLLAADANPEGRAVEQIDLRCAGLLLRLELGESLGAVCVLDHLDAGLLGERLEVDLAHCPLERTAPTRDHDLLLRLCQGVAGNEGSDRLRRDGAAGHRERLLDSLPPGNLACHVQLPPVDWVSSCVGSHIGSAYPNPSIDILRAP